MPDSVRNTLFASFLACLALSAHAQGALPTPPGAGDRGIVASVPERAPRGSIQMHFVYRVRNRLDPAQRWESTDDQLALPGQKVQIKIVSQDKDLVVMAELEPVPLDKGSVRLNTKSRIWMSKGDKLSYVSSMSNIVVKYGEEVVFYPLGSEQQDADTIEILILMNQAKPE
jgi:hypothetical protein